MGVSGWNWIEGDIARFATLTNHIATSIPASILKNLLDVPHLDNAQKLVMLEIKWYY
jgi:hypothetical protein